MKKNKRLILILAILRILGIGQGVLAAGLNVAWPSSPLGTELNDQSEIPEFITYIYEWGISIGGVLVFIALIIAGFQYLGSAGNPAMMKEAKDRVISALLGLALLLGSWLILNTINPQFTRLQLPPFNPDEGKPTFENLEPLDVEDFKGVEPCKKVEIVRPEHPTITLDAESGVKDLDPYISTNEEFDVKAYIDGKATSCGGYVVFYAEQEGHTSIGADIFLNTSPEDREGITVSKECQSVQFFPYKKK